MPRRLSIQSHLSLEELERRYKKAVHGIERSHYQVIWLLAQGKQSAEVAEVTGYGVDWVRTLARRYNAEGPAGLGDQRQHNPGHPRLLRESQETELKQEVEAAYEAGHPMNGVQVARRMSELVGHPVYAVRGWEYLKRWGFKRKKPRPQHVKHDPGKAAWTKKLNRLRVSPLPSPSLGTVGDG